MRYFCITRILPSVLLFPLFKNSGFTCADGHRGWLATQVSGSVTIYIIGCLLRCPGAHEFYRDGQRLPITWINVKEVCQLNTTTTLSQEYFCSTYFLLFLPAEATAVLFFSIVAIFFCWSDNFWSAALSWMKFCTNVYLDNNIKVIGHRSRSRGVSVGMILRLPTRST